MCFPRGIIKTKVPPCCLVDHFHSAISPHIMFESSLIGTMQRNEQTISRRLVIRLNDNRISKHSRPGTKRSMTERMRLEMRANRMLLRIPCDCVAYRRISERKTNLSKSTRITKVQQCVSIAYRSACWERTPKGQFSIQHTLVSRIITSYVCIRLLHLESHYL